MTNLQNIINKYGSSFPEYNFPKREREFAKLSELTEGTKYPIQALFINTKGKFGDQGVIYTEDKIINLPKHLLSLVQELRADSEVTQAINEGQLAFETYSYSTDEGRTGYSINIVPTNSPSEDSKGRAFNNEELPF